MNTPLHYFSILTLILAPASMTLTSCGGQDKRNARQDARQDKRDDRQEGRQDNRDTRQDYRDNRQDTRQDNREDRRN